MSPKQQAVKAALASMKGVRGKAANLSSAQEGAEDKGKSLPMAGQNSAQGLPDPKKPSAAKPTKKPPLFNPDLVKFPDGKAGKAVVGKKKRPAGAVFWPTAKTRKV